MTVRSFALGTVLAMAVTMLAAPALAADPPKAWDQAAVTSIAEKFSTQVTAVQRSVSRQQTGAQVGSGQAHAFLRLQDDLRVLRNGARHLERTLQKGGGHDETVAPFQRMMTTLRDARENANKMFLEKPTLDMIAQARASLRELVPYYDPALVADIDAQAERRR